MGEKRILYNIILLFLVLGACLAECQETLRRCIEEVDNPALSASISAPDYFREFIDYSLSCVCEFEDSFKVYLESNEEESEKLTGSSIRLAHRISNYVIQGKTTSNSSRDIEFAES